MPRKTKAAKKAEGEDVLSSAAGAASSKEETAASSSSGAEASSSSAAHAHRHQGISEAELAKGLDEAQHHPGHVLRDRVVIPSDVEGHVLRDSTVIGGPALGGSSAALETKSSSKKLAVGQKRGRQDISGKEGEDEEGESSLSSFGSPGIFQGLQASMGAESLLKGVGHGLVKQVLYTIPHPPKDIVKTVDDLKQEVALRYHCANGAADLKFITADSTPSSIVELDGNMPIKDLIEPFRAWVKERPASSGLGGAAGGPGLGGEQEKGVAVKEWVFWLNRQQHPVKAESVLTHGSLATAHVMEVIEENASKVAEGMMTGEEFDQKTEEAKEEAERQEEGLAAGGGGIAEGAGNIDLTQGQ